MGQLVIEIPENINRLFHIKNSKFTKKLLRELEENEVKKSNLIPPRRNSLKEDGDAVLGIWSYREESAEEIARTIRDKNNGKI
jgi:hypothetical protein